MIMLDLMLKICILMNHTILYLEKLHYNPELVCLQKKNLQILTTVGIYSFARYDPAFFGEEREENYEKLKLLRTVTVMTHEICHQFGIEHCTYFHCVMNGANHLEVVMDE